MTDYITLNNQLSALIGEVPYLITNLSNASALLFESLSDINWAGFYLMQDSKLVLGPFQGKVACTEIEIGKGVCGTAVLENSTQCVPDVHKFPGHIACDSASNSEIVIPIRYEGRVIGVLDIDSPKFERFDDSDCAGLEEFVGILESSLCKSRLLSNII